MKYENGRDIFPDDLLHQIQKYAAGKLVYIPSGDKRREWGESSGYKLYLAQRNRDIKKKHQSGISIEQLSQDYYLSCESIKRIVYSKKEATILDYCCTLTSARVFAQAGRLEEWIHAYLLSDGLFQTGSSCLTGSLSARSPCRCAFFSAAAARKQACAGV